jgi:hypothetical protein
MAQGSRLRAQADSGLISGLMHTALPDIGIRVPLVTKAGQP